MRPAEPLTRAKGVHTLAYPVPTPAEFEAYFHKRASFAEDLYRQGWRNEAHLVATVALDSLANIWRHTLEPLPANAAKSSALRQLEFVQKFTGDPDVNRIVVIFLAEDIIARRVTRLIPLAERLLRARVASYRERPTVMEMRESPAAHLDKDWQELVHEEPDLARETALEKTARHYTYPAMLWRLYRCSLAHSLSKGDRTSDFSGSEPDDEVSYFPAWTDGARQRPISLKLGLKATTNWIRAGVTGYAKECTQQGVDPVGTFNPTAVSLAELLGDKVWRGVK